jgi:hypothetical protein
MHADIALELPHEARGEASVELDLQNPMDDVSEPQHNAEASKERGHFQGFPSVRHTDQFGVSIVERSSRNQRFCHAVERNQ